MVTFVLSACASASIPKSSTPGVTQRQFYNKPYDSVWEASKTAINYDGGTIVAEYKSSGLITYSTGVDAKTKIKKFVNIYVSEGQDKKKITVYAIPYHSWIYTTIKPPMNKVQYTVDDVSIKKNLFEDTSNDFLTKLNNILMEQ